jgi:outer membrane protein OmpA-like peptidoglycan-associated protein
MKKIWLVLFVVSYSAHAQLPVFIHETFDNNRYGWIESDAKSHKVFLKDGKYFIEADEEGWMSFVSPYVDRQKEYSFEATFTQLEGQNDSGIGFIWGHDGKQQTNSFTFSSNGMFRIWSSNQSLLISDEWKPTTAVRAGKENKLKVSQKNGQLTFSINGKQVATTKNFPWFGKYIGFIAGGKMKLAIDDFILSQEVKIKLPNVFEPPGVKENLGPSVNSKYEEVSPKISADGKTLYFGRKHSPENVGGIQDKEDIWESQTTDGATWSLATNIGSPVNTNHTNNLIAVSADNNSFLFHVNGGFSFMHRTTSGWSPLEDIGIKFENETEFLEGSLSADGKAIVFVAKTKSNAYYSQADKERDIYVCLKLPNGKWSDPIHTGNVLNSPGNEYSPFLSADGRTLFFGTNGRPGYGDVDIFMSKRLSEDWKEWTEPVNLGLGVNTVGFDAYYTLPASGEHGYMVSNIQTLGLTDIIRFKIPPSMKPGPVVLIAGRVLNSKTKKPLAGIVHFDDLETGKEVGEAHVNPKTGEYKIVLPGGKHYGYHAAAHGFLSVNENLEIKDLEKYGELKKDLMLVPIAIGESVQLKNVFFVQSKSDLKPESYPELDRLVKIMKDNPTIEILLTGHTDNRGTPEANLELSEKRVEAVRQYLISKGVPPRRMTGKGFGGSKPIAPSTTEENRQLNRRVEFTIVKS